MSASRIAALLGILLLLAGCSSSDDNDTPTDPNPNEPDTYTVTYDGNGADSGSVPVDSTEYEEGGTVTVAAAGNLGRSGYTFDGWNTAANGAGAAHAAGSQLVMGAADVTLYAQWSGNSTGDWDPSLGSWGYLGDAGLSEDTVEYCRLVLDSAGDPVIAYTLTAPAIGTPKQRIMSWNGSVFVSHGGSADLADNAARFLDLACDDTDNFWIVTTNTDNNGVSVCFDGTNWIEPVQFTADRYTFQPSLTIDDDSDPLMAVRTRPNDDQILAILGWTGTMWSELADGNIESPLDNNTDITMVDGTPYVFWADSMQNGFVSRANGDGSGWEVVGGASVHPYNGVKSLVIETGPLGRPWILYRNNGDLYVKYWDETQWVALDTSEFDNDLDTSSVPDRLGLTFVGDVPVVAFVSTGSPRGIRVYAWTGGAWVQLTGDSTAATSGSHYPQLASTEDGRIFLGYKDASADGKMSVKVYTPAP